MQLIRTLRIMPALVVALVALFVVASGSAMASTAGQHHGPVASAAHHKKKKKPKKPKAPKAPKAPKGPFVAKDAGSTPIGTGPDDTLVETLSVPAGSTYVVTAKAELGNNAASDNSITCKLLEGFNPIDTGTEALAPLATFSRTITLTSTSSGGSIKLVCSGDKAGQARNRVITAVRSS
jgi:glucose/arabinose dehydrogenase